MVDALAAKVRAAQAAQAALATGSTDLADATGKAAGGMNTAAAAANSASSAHAGFYREVIVFGHEILTGNYSRIPGSIAVLAERTGNLEDIAKSALAALTSVPGIIAVAGVAATAAFVTMAVEAENANLATQKLATQLMATRADYDSLAQTVTQSAKAFAQVPGVNLTDSKAAAQTIAAAPTFSGSSQDLNALLALSNQIALVWNTTLPDAAKKVADAMKDPAAAAKELAAEGFPAMSEALAESVQRLEDQGKTLEAQQIVLKAYGDGTEDATAHVSSFQQALRDLDDAFTSSSNHGHSWGEAIGQAVLGVAEAAVRAAAGVANTASTIGKNIGDSIDKGLMVGPSAPGGPSQVVQFDATELYAPTGVPFSQRGATGTFGNDAQAQAQVANAARQQLLAAADKAAGGSSSVQALRDQITLLKSAQDAVGTSDVRWKEYQDQIDKDNLSIQRFNDSLTKHEDQLAKQLGTINDATNANKDMTTALLAGGDATLYATAADKAQADAMKDTKNGKVDSTAAVEALTQANLDLLQSEGALKAAQDVSSMRDELDTIKTETDLVTASTAARDHELAVLKERQAILKASHGDETALDTDAAKAALDYAGRVADATSALQHQQQVVNDLSSAATQAFDQVGNAIAQAFTNGNGAAVNFGNIFKAVISSILQEVAKLAVINPLLNSLVGGTRTTLSDVGGLLGGSSGGSGLGDLSNIFSLGSKLTGFDPLSSIGNSLGLTGSGGLLSSSLWAGTATSSSVAGSALYGGAEGGAEALGIGAGSGVTLGSLLGGAGAGFAGGELLNSLLGGNSTGGSIGSAGGAAAGAAIGSIIPGVGTIIGGLLGGLAGGGLGGLFGPGPAHHGWGIDINTNSAGQLQIASSSADKFDNSAEVNAVTSQIASLNSLLTTMGIQAAVVNPGSTGGQNRINLGGNNGVAQPVSLTDTNVFDKLQFSSSTNADLNAALAGKSFLSATDLQNFTTLVTTTIPSLTTNSGSLAAQISALGDTFQAAKLTANEYGVSQDSLNAALAKQVTTLQNAAAEALSQTEQGFQARIDNATGDTADGSLLEFDISAQQQRDQLAQQLTSTYGDAYAATADYARITGELNTALADERAQVIANTAAQADAARQAAAQQGGTVIGGLSSFAQSLLSGDANPASAWDQFSAAQKSFLGVASGAAGGDVTSLSQLQSYSTTYLDTARNLYGSGNGYVQAFQQVISALQGASAVTPDTLTASVMRETTQAATDTLAGCCKDCKGRWRRSPSR